MKGLPEIDRHRPILIAGPTACGKSALALRIAQEHGGVIVNADASQVYDCWRVITARPSIADEALVPHQLYGHVPWNAPYSSGHWLREVTALLNGPERVIIVGGTGLYFMALTVGMADIPAIAPEIRARADDLSLAELAQILDTDTCARIDMANRARVQRAWEVQTATGRSLADWQAATPPPVLALENTVPLLFDAPKDWLEPRINRRFDAMLRGGALDEVAQMQGRYDPALPAWRAIGAPELLAHMRGEITLDQARDRVRIATRRFAKRQRTWFRAKMRQWHPLDPAI